MIFVRKIDDDGLFIEDALLDAIPITEDGSPDQHYIETPCPDGFYHPRWDGNEWVEGGTEPEHVVTVDMLKQQLCDTDYRVIKCYEYQLAGLELPYDIAELHTERQAIRDKIAEIEGGQTV